MKKLFQSLVPVALTVAALGAGAQAAFPSKPITIIVPFAAGGPTDKVARDLAEALRKPLGGATVIVDNAAGAGGSIGANKVAKAPADGYTLLMATAGNLTVNQHLYKNMKFDPVKDFTPITQTAAVDFVLVSQPNAPFKSVKELIAAAKAKPQSISTATSGNGGAPHLAAALFENAAKVNLQLVPYKGTADAVNAVLGGQTHLDFDAASQVLPHIKAGKLKPLAVLGTKRSPLLPEVPTMAEAGLPSYNFSNWFGLVGPAGLPKDVQAKLQKDVNEVLQNTEIKARYQTMGLQAPTATTSAQFAGLIEKDAAKWGATIKAANIVAE
jgi:tripartite-type tricarboxylate transporter receptor subunit TctC